jgi:hypothetical protein
MGDLRVLDERGIMYFTFMPGVNTYKSEIWAEYFSISLDI